MPYIKKGDGRREALQKGEPALTAGELNYQIFYYVKHNNYPNFEIIKNFINNFLGEIPNYQRYNDMTGCLLRCAKEIKRRLDRDYTVILWTMCKEYDNEIAKYEDKKCLINGDVE